MDLDEFHQTEPAGDCSFYERVGFVMWIRPRLKHYCSWLREHAEERYYIGVQHKWYFRIDTEVFFGEDASRIIIV